MYLPQALALLPDRLATLTMKSPKENEKPMNTKPDSNLEPEKRETGPPDPPAGGDHIVIYGDVGPGANVGRGSARSDYNAGRDLIINGVVAETPDQFADLLAELHGLIQEAQQAGELDEPTAQDVLSSLESATDMIRQETKPVKSKLIKKLQYVADVIDAAVDVFDTQAGGVAKFLLRALPFAALLVKLASRIF